MNSIPFLQDCELRALSFKQPYAQLMLHGKIETRTWATPYRGYVLICASRQPFSKRKTQEIAGSQYQSILNTVIDVNSLPLGQAIAIGRLVDCRRMEPEDEEKCFVRYSEGLYCHVYEDVLPLTANIPWRGALSWKSVDELVKKTLFMRTMP